MPPDLSSLSHSNSASSTPHRNRPSVDNPLHPPPPAMASPSEFVRRPSRGSSRAGRSSFSERRRSGQNLNLGESATEFGRPSSIGGSPIIGTGDPHHQRTPSLGELHQELEQEQEAQVNRLLHMIRSQQSQLQQLQQQQAQSHQQSSSAGTAIVDDPTPPSENSASFPPIPPLPSGSRASTQLSSSLSSRRQSRPSSQAASPSLQPYGTSGESRGPEGLEWITGPSESPVRRGSRDESSFYQAEASMLNRENQMLRQRIRDLERQVNELSASRSLPVRQPESAEQADVEKS